MDNRVCINAVAATGNLEAVRACIEQEKRQVDERNQNGETPLISAASRNHLDVVKYLVDRGANLETSDIDGQTALMKAVAGEHLTIVEYLCALGVDVNVRNNVGQAAIHQKKPLQKNRSGYSYEPPGVSDNAKAIVTILLRYGARLSMKTENNETALHLLANGNVTEGAKQLRQPWLEAIEVSGDLNELQYFIELQGRSVRERSWELLTCAYRRRDLSMFEYLVDRAVVVPTNSDLQAYTVTASCLGLRQAWVKQLMYLANKWHLPLIALREIHEHAIGFNWHIVLAEFEAA